MAQNSLPNYLSLLNQQITAQVLLSEYLFQMNALFEVALENNFLCFKKITIHYYLSSISDIVNEAKGFNEKRLNDLMQLARDLSKKMPPVDEETRH